MKKMYDINWTEPNIFDKTEDEVVLQHAIARYHASVQSICLLVNLLTNETVSLTS